MNLNYYENYSGLTVEEYVHKYIRSSPKEMNRIIETIDLVPNDVENVLDIGAGHGIFLEELDKIKKFRFYLYTHSIQCLYLSGKGEQFM